MSHSRDAQWILEAEDEIDAGCAFGHLEPSSSIQG